MYSLSVTEAVGLFVPSPVYFSEFHLPQRIIIIIYNMYVWYGPASCLNTLLGRPEVQLLALLQAQVRLLAA